MSLKKLWHRAVNRAYDDSYELARVGKHNPDASTTLAVVGLADYLWVTLADQTTVQARNDAGVPQTIDLEVWVRAETNAGGGAPTHVIEGRSAAGLLSAPTTTPPSGVLTHATTHQHGGTDEVATATPAANAIPKADGSGLLDAWVTPPPDTFTDLSDTPSSYATHGGKVVKVNVGETALEFAAEAGALVTSVNTQTGDVVLDADDIDDAATTNKFATAAELTKLAGIEAGADVTDAVNTGAAIDGTADLGAPVDTDKLAAVRGGSLGTILISALKTMLNGLYVGLTGNQTVAGDKTFSGITILSNGSKFYSSSGGISATVDAPAGTVKYFTFQTGSVNRFVLGVSNDAEGGSDDGSNFILQSRTDAGAPKSVVLQIMRQTGFVGIGTTSPQGILHTYANGAGHLNITKTGINGTAQTIIPNGAGDVTIALMPWGYIYDGTNRGTFITPTTVAPGAETSVTVSGTNTYALRVNADGSVDIRRTAGSAAGTAVLFLMWS